MAENIIKKLCKCASCGNESEMTITCSLDFDETPTSAKEPDVKAPALRVPRRAERLRRGIWSQ